MFLLFAGKPFSRSFVNYSDLNFEENSKLNVAITFQFLFFRIRIDQSIAFQVAKVPKGEDSSAEVPRRGGVRAYYRDYGRKEEGAFYLSMLRIYPHLQG